VTPTFSFAFGPVTAASGQVVQFEIDYDIFLDAATAVSGASLALDGIGGVFATEFFCNDILYVRSGGCLGGSAPESLSVGTQGTGSPSSANITFSIPATDFEEVAIVFTLTGGATGASINSLGAESAGVGVTPVPEIPTGTGLIIGLLALVSGFHLRNRYAQ
jgi:hypothetical protein